MKKDKKLQEAVPVLNFKQNNGIFMLADLRSQGTYNHHTSQHIHNLKQRSTKKAHLATVAMPRRSHTTQIPYHHFATPFAQSIEQQRLILQPLPRCDAATRIPYQPLCK